MAERSVPSRDRIDIDIDIDGGRRGRRVGVEPSPFVRVPGAVAIDCAREG
jgi:hypothetical protein